MAQQNPVKRMAQKNATNNWLSKSRSPETQTISSEPLMYQPIMFQPVSIHERMGVICFYNLFYKPLKVQGGPKKPTMGRVGL